MCGQSFVPAISTCTRFVLVQVLWGVGKALILDAREHRKSLEQQQSVLLLGSCAYIRLFVLGMCAY